MTQHRSHKKSFFSRLFKSSSKKKSSSDSRQSRDPSASNEPTNQSTPAPRKRPSKWLGFVGKGSSKKRTSSLRSRRHTFFGILLAFPQYLLRLLQNAVLKFFQFQENRSLASMRAEERGKFKNLKVIHFLNPLKWITWPFRFIFSYVLSRPYLSLGPALLAILVFAGAIGLVAQRRGSGGSSRVQLYQKLLAENLQKKNFDSALICSKTLIDIAPNDLRFKFERAKIEKELGHKEFADELMMRLATVDKYGLAAIWLADERFNLAEVSKWPEESHQLYRGLLAIALSNSDKFSIDAAKLKMASYLTQMNAYSEALNYLEDLTTNNPQFAFTAVELAAKVRDRVRLQTLLPVALNYQRQELTKDPANVQLRIYLARTLVIDEQIDEALQLLADGVQLKKDPALLNAYGEAHILKASQLAQRKQTVEVIVQRMQLVLQAAAIAPNSPLVIEALIDLALDFRKNDNQEIQVLREAALQGLNPEAVHFVRGTIALLDNNIAEAKLHLDLAAKSGEQLPGLLNNLAVAIASQEGGDLQQALNFSNTALEKLQHPYLYETRGQILLKMERYQDCIIDLEKGLQAKELAPAIYPSLITAYKKLNNETLAQEFEKRLQEILSANEASKTKQDGESTPANSNSTPESAVTPVNNTTSTGDSPDKK